MKTISLIAGLLVSYSFQHAVVVYPTPWDLNPSKSYPCGDATAPLSSSDIANISSSLSGGLLEWKVVAPDGGGTVTGMIDPTGTMNFTIPIPDLSGSAPQVGSYNFQFTLPVNLTCTNPAGVCTARIKSSSNWNSCFSFRVIQGAPVDPSKLPSARYACEEINNLGFCTQFNGQSLNVSLNANPNQLDAQLASFYQASIKNPNVFTNGQSTDCTNRLPFLLCGQAFNGGYCGTSSYLNMPDSSYCEDTLKVCGVTDSHKSLFDCSKSPQADAQQQSKGMKPYSGWSSIFILSMLYFIFF